MQNNHSEKYVYLILEGVLDCARWTILILILFIGLYLLIDSIYINSGGIRESYQQYIPIHSEEKGMKNFEQLSINNPDVIAWIKVDGTRIDYPVLAGESNEEYLFMNENREYSSSGSIFIDSFNTRDFSDFNTIIYGHHMQFGGMFGDLEKFCDKKTFNIIKYGSIYYKNKEHKVEFFAFLDEADGYDFEIYNPGIKNDTERLRYIDNLYSKSKYRRDIDVNITDRIILLSTCSQTMTNGRYILVGRFIDSEIPINNVTIEERRSDNVKVIWKLIIIFSIFLLILIVLIIIRRRAK